jgi:hypothetical protein
MEIQFLKFPVDRNFRLAAHLTIKLQKTSPISQAVSHGLKTETQKIKLYRVPVQISAFFFTVNNFRLFGVGSQAALFQTILHPSKSVSVPTASG